MFGIPALYIWCETPALSNSETNANKKEKNQYLFRFYHKCHYLCAFFGEYPETGQTN